MVLAWVWRCTGRLASLPQQDQGLPMGCMVIRLIPTRGSEPVLHHWFGKVTKVTWFENLHFLIVIISPRNGFSSLWLYIEIWTLKNSQYPTWAKIRGPEVSDGVSPELREERFYVTDLTTLPLDPIISL